MQLTIEDTMREPVAQALEWRANHIADEAKSARAGSLRVSLFNRAAKLAELAEEVRNG